MSIEKIKTVSTQVSGVEGSSRAIFVMITIADRNINGDLISVNDSHVHLALGNTKASLEQYGYVVSNCAWIADLPSVELNEGESVRVSNIATMEKITPDIIENGEEVLMNLEEESETQVE